MSKSVKADWAQTAPAAGIVGLREYIQDIIGSAIDISSVGGAGFLNGQVPVWSAGLGRFEPGNISDIRGYVAPEPSTGGTTIQDLDEPGVATKRYPPGFTFGDLQNVWFKQVFDVRQYGAIGGASADDTDPVNHAIDDLNTAGGGMLVFQAGTYRLGALNTIQYPCLIVGQGMGATSLEFTGAGFFGGQDGHFFGATNLTALTTGTGGGEIAFEISNGTSTGSADPFLFVNLDLSGWEKCFLINTITRGGFISRSRLAASDTVIDLTANDSSIFDCQIIAESTSCIGIANNGDRNKFTGNRFYGGTDFDTGILGTSGDRCSVADTLIVGTTGDGIELSDGSGGTLDWRVQNISFADITGEPVRYNVDKHYVNDLQGLGGNTNTAFDDRRELLLEFTYDPGSIGPLQAISNDFVFVGAKPGAQLAIGAPYDLQGVLVTACIRSADTLSLILFNSGLNGLSPVDLGSGTWKVRLFS